MILAADQWGEHCLSITVSVSGTLYSVITEYATQEEITTYLIKVASIFSFVSVVELTEETFEQLEVRFRAKKAWIIQGE